MQRQVEDGIVALLFYEERVPGLTINEEAGEPLSPTRSRRVFNRAGKWTRRKFASKQAVHGAANRLELMSGHRSAFPREHQETGVRSEGSGGARIASSWRFVTSSTWTIRAGDERRIDGSVPDSVKAIPRRHMLPEVQKCERQRA